MLDAIASALACSVQVKEDWILLAALQVLGGEQFIVDVVTPRKLLAIQFDRSRLKLSGDLRRYVITVTCFAKFVRFNALKRDPIRTKPAPSDGGQLQGKASIEML
ncbi:hypothetical protein [Blastopirellula marina]|uniref:hypothetical protein n=1 Tax=Blastopirellula marina TaxID=124 RepID=UPI001E33CBA1|nr:hypothetical protein [Blastopirellula marina]